MVDASLRSDVSENKIFQITYENSFKKLLSSQEVVKEKKTDDANEDEIHQHDSIFDDEGDEVERGNETDTLILMRNLLFSKKQDTERLLTKALLKKKNLLSFQQDQTLKQAEDEMFEYNQKKQMQEQEGKQETQGNPQNTQMMQKFMKNEKIKKILSGGKFFQLSQNKKEFERSTNQTKDYLTLVRHATWIRLVKHGFKLRHFLSSNAKTIYTVCYATDENLKITAEKEKLNKALNLEFSDLLSLEPVDQTLRPLRMNTRLRLNSHSLNDDEEEGENEETEKISGYLKHIRFDIQKYLQIIDYKKIARETNISKLNIEIINEKTVEIKKDENLTNHQWELYLQYLNQVSEKVSEIREQYRFHKDDKRAQKINEIIEFQKCQHPLQQIINQLLKRNEVQRTDQNRNTDESMTNIRVDNTAMVEDTDLPEHLVGFDLQIEHFKEIRVKEDIKSNQKKLSQKEKEKEQHKQRQSDMKAMRKLYKDNRDLEAILQTRSKRIRYLMVDLVNDPSQLKKRYELVKYIFNSLGFIV